MFFHWNNFSHYLTEDQARLTAKVANDIIDKSGLVMYGNETEDGQCLDFTSEQKKTDTHVGIVIGLEMMGSLKRTDAAPKIDKPTKDDFTRAERDQLEYLKKRNAQLEGK